MRIKIVFFRNVFTVCIYLSTHSGNRQIIRLNGHFIPHFNYVKVWNKIPKKYGIESCQNLGKEYFKPLQTKLETFKNIFSMIIDVKLGLQLLKWLNIFCTCTVIPRFRGLYRVTRKNKIQNNCTYFFGHPVHCLYQVHPHTGKNREKISGKNCIFPEIFPFFSQCIEWWYESVQAQQY